MSKNRKLLKKKMLGNINFIGELYKKEMLPPVALTGCFNVLLPKEGQSADEDSIEMCCKLLTSVGQKLDRQGGKSSKRNKGNGEKKKKKNHQYDLRKLKSFIQS